MRQVGLTRFDGHPSSGVYPRKDVRSWKAWGRSPGGSVVRSRLSSRRRSWSCASAGTGRELAQLRAENRRLREDEILKAATAFFALRRPGELLPVHRGGESAAVQVKRACELLKVSRAAYYAARDGRPSDRDRQDAELTTRITAEHKRPGAGTGRRGSMPSCAARATATPASGLPG